jgi:hypothetical protein
VNFKPEILLKIYLEGSLTPKAQAEFDRLMRRDPLFAEKVTMALAGKLGPLPDSQVEAIASRLEPKLAEIWRSAKPRPWRLYFQLGWKVFLVVVALVAMGFGFFMLLFNQQGNPGGVVPKDEPLSLVVLQDASVRKTVKRAARDVPAAPAIPVSGLPGTAVLPLLPETCATLTEEGALIRLSIHMEKTQEVEVKVLDSNGIPARTLYHGVWNTGDHTLDWDGKDDSGKLLPSGDYLVSILSGGKTQSSPVHLRSNS